MVEWSFIEVTFNRLRLSLLFQRWWSPAKRNLLKVMNVKSRIYNIHSLIKRVEIFKYITLYRNYDFYTIITQDQTGFVVMGLYAKCLFKAIFQYIFVMVLCELRMVTFPYQWNRLTTYIIFCQLSLSVFFYSRYTSDLVISVIEMRFERCCPFSTIIHLLNKESQGLHFFDCHLHFFVNLWPYFRKLTIGVAEIHALRLYTLAL